MIRVLTFEGPKAPRRFELLWTALISAGDGKGERTPATIRKEARLQDTFDRLSVVKVNGTDTRTLLPDGGTVELTQDDFDLLQQYAEKTLWNPAFSREVVDLWDFLSAAEKRD